MGLLDQKPGDDAGSEAAQIYHASLSRCQADPSFLEKFYESFLSASPRVAEKFKGVDFRRQVRVLQATLYMVSLLVTGDEFAQDHLLRIARTHGPEGYNIEPDLYGLWKKTLIGTVSQTDPAFDETVEEAWHQVLQSAIEFMLTHQTP
ncbi:MAG: globin [Phycisphaeraceae bacterium]|nr:globin [Phycisphaeraceae bacterium]